MIIHTLLSRNLYGIDRKVQQDLIRQAFNELKEAPPFVKSPPGPWALESLKYPESDVVKEVADAWVHVSDLQANLPYLTAFGTLQNSIATRKSEDILKAFAPFRILPTSGVLPNGLANDKTIFVVLIAVGEWNHQDGFFFEDVVLSAGEDFSTNGCRAIDWIRLY